MGNNLWKKWEYWNRIIGRIHGIMCTSLTTALFHCKDHLIMNHVIQVNHYY